MVNEWLTGAELAVDGGHGGLQAPTTTDYRLAAGVDTPKLVKTGGWQGRGGLSLGHSGVSLQFNWGGFKDGQYH